MTDARSPTAEAAANGSDPASADLLSILANVKDQFPWLGWEVGTRYSLE